MSTVVVEKWESRSAAAGESPTVDLVYVVMGTDNDLTAKTAIEAELPATYDGLVYQDYTIERVGDEAWLVEARYGLQSPKETGDSTYQFETGGGSQRITQSISTSNSYAASGAAPDYKGAIGVTRDSVEGCDIIVPTYNFSETHYIAVASVTEAYKATLFGLTGKVNNAAFRGFSAGEVLFLGASGSQRGEDDWEITFKFSASPNVTGLSVGDITGIDKKGWEYLWVSYEDESDNTAKRLVKRPIAAYVEQVYESGDFSGLGI